MSGAARAVLGGARLGDGRPVAVMGVLNVSPESFYQGSVPLDDEALLDRACAMVEAGAALIDVGARSTAPYLPTAIGEDEERRRLERAVGRLASRLSVPVSADTAHAGPARAALDAGARVINDTTGLADQELANLVAAYEAGLIVMASPAADEEGARDVRAAVAAEASAAGAPEERAAGASGGRVPATPLATVRRCLAASLDRARAAGIPEERVVVDPGIGFFREGAVPWDAWDAEILANLDALRDLGRPLCVAISRKSFVGEITGRRTPADRLAGSLAATAIAVWNGAALIRTHDVAETLDAIRIASRLSAARLSAAPEP